MNPKVTIEELSRLIDGELTPEERQDIEARLEACPVSQALRERLQGLTNTVSTLILAAPQMPEAARSEACLGEGVLCRPPNRLPPPRTANHPSVLGK